ncbi:cation/H(+) antiporter 15 isoform X1 [Coffea arabica]|uniref:Cation/H(+) antiporter 15 isoform X1 n=2 Tax=Coffea arabica TaxID=13443 RepID=A0A6P6W817_COFAR|nr:cation/H(+) antiporter 15-like isoform X1 [Coffea arabica]
MQVGQSIPHGELPGETDGQQHECVLNEPIHYPGIWTPEGAHDFLHHALPRLEFQLSAIFLITQFLHLLFRPFKFQRIVSEFLAGVILGPSCMGKISKFSEIVFPAEDEIFLDILSKVGYVFFMFLAGVHMDISTITRSGKKAWTIGLVSVAITMIVVTGFNSVLYNILHQYHVPAAKAIVGIQILTPFAVVASLLIDLKIVNSEIGRLALACTLISDLITSPFTAWMRFAYADMDKSVSVKTTTTSIIIILAAILVLRPLFMWIIKQTPEGQAVRGFYIVLVSLSVLLSAVVSDSIGLQYHFGPFIVGLTVPSGPPLGSTLAEKLETLISGLFAPLIISTCGLKFDILKVYDAEFLQIVWIIIFVFSVVKFISVILPALMCKLPIRDATVLSAIMSSQGIVELALCQNYFMNQAIDRETFASVTSSVLLVDIVTSLTIRLLYDYSRKYTGYQKRDIQDLASNSEFRILLCTHRQDDALAAIKLLHMSNPTRGSPIGVYALHLEKLVGKAAPVLINHELGQKSSSLGFRSTKVIDIFRFQGDLHPGFISVQCFTSVSLPQFMQEDICSLAFDKVTSILILPFHRKWNHQGRLIHDSKVIRTINCSVLDMAPCSVGILIDRKKMSNPSRVPSVLHRVAVLFLGGNDDREALAYGLRMAKSPGVHLSVVRLISREDVVEDEWEKVLDAESLRAFKLRSSQQDNVAFKEEMVNDESDTALLVHQVAEVFDLIMVGRRHRGDSPLLSGLIRWTELPELGPLGDMLAAADFQKPVSVLVVQQQMNKIKG